jgi:hypothetical protein
MDPLWLGNDLYNPIVLAAVSVVQLQLALVCERESIDTTYLRISH